MLLWMMVVCQMIVWAWFSAKGGKLSDKEFLIFTVGMMTGMLAAGIETYYLASWRAFTVQVYFFIFTAVGGIQRLRQMRSR